MYSDQKSFTQMVTAATGVIALGTAGIVGRLFPGMTPITVHQIWATITVAADAAETLTFHKRPTPGSTTGASTIGVLTIPDTTAAGKQLYKKVTPVKVLPGQEIALETAGNSTNLVAACGIVAYPTWEEPAANTNMIASA